MPRKQNTHPEDYNEALPSNLRSLMQQKNLTQQTLANYLNVTRQSVSYYCDGSSTPDWKTVVKLADYFGVSTDYLSGRTKTKTPDTTAQAVIDYTGLTEDNIATLHNAAENAGEMIISHKEQTMTFDGNKPFLDCLNDLLDAVFFDRETIIKHYIRLRRTTMKPDSTDLWYLMGHPTPIAGFEPQRYTNNYQAQFMIDNELVEYDCLKIAKEIEKYLKNKYIASRDDLDAIMEDDFNGND